jgi:type IV secretory pathway VirJ component
LLLILATAVVSIAPAVSSESTLQFGRFGKVTLYAPEGTPRRVALFVSGDGGWNQGVVDMARELLPMGALVVGIDIRTYLSSLAKSSEKCSYAAADFEELSQFVQRKAELPTYTRPVLIGYSSGATLVYAALVQAPPGTFRGALSLGFCSDLTLGKPFCRGRGLEWKPGPKGNIYLFEPDSTLAEPWIALQGLIDQVCDPPATQAFVEKVAKGEIVTLPKVGHGFSKPANWLAQFKEAYRKIAESEDEAAALPAEAVADLPLIELRAVQPASGMLAVILSGDGGWAGLDREVGRYLADHGVDVVGVNSLKYLWKRRTPEELAKDVERVARHYMNSWSKSDLTLLGYSSGADILPFVPSRLSPETLARVRAVVLLAPSKMASFEFHVSDWLKSSARETDRPVLPEVRRITGPKLLCFYGAAEQDESLCPELAPPAEVIRIEGGHHFGGDYLGIAEKILGALQIEPKDANAKP